MLGVLGEAQAGVDDDPVRVDPAGHRALHAPRELVDDLGDHVPVDGAVVHVDGLAPPVHHHERDVVRGHHGHHRRVGGAPADVVDQARPGLHGLLGDRGAHGVDGDHDTGRGELADDGDDPAQLLGLVHPRRARPGRLAAHVHHVGALRHQVETVFDGEFGVEPVTAVGERIGRHIDDAHHRAAFPVRQSGHLATQGTHGTSLGRVPTGRIAAVGCGAAPGAGTVPDTAERPAPRRPGPGAGQAARATAPAALAGSGVCTHGRGSAGFRRRRTRGRLSSR